MKAEIATVFRCFDGRRYFTIKGAAGHEVSVLMRKKYCECSGHPSDASEAWYTCRFHQDFMTAGTHYEKLGQRLLKIRIRQFKKGLK